MNPRSQDLHIHTTPGGLNEVKLFIREMGLSGELSEVSLSDHESLEIYNLYPIIDYGLRYQVKIVKSFTMIARYLHQGQIHHIELLIINPKKTSLGLLESVIIPEKIRTINHILYNLREEGFIIDPEDLISEMGGSHFYLIHLTTTDMLLEKLVSDGFFANKREAFSSLLSYCLIERLYPKLENILNLLGGEESVYIINPQEHPIEIINKSLNRIKGFIIDFDDLEFNTFATLSREKQLNIRNGTGRTL